MSTYKVVLKETAQLDLKKLVLTAFGHYNDK